MFDLFCLEYSVKSACRQLSNAVVDIIMDVCLGKTTLLASKSC